jgi:hypothetical protein
MQDLIESLVSSYSLFALNITVKQFTSLIPEFSTYFGQMSLIS